MIRVSGKAFAVPAGEQKKWVDAIFKEQPYLANCLLYTSEPLEAEGTFTSHPLYGEQLSVERYQVTAPEDVISIERYLGSGAVKGIGPQLAARIVKKFKADTLRIIDEEPERLSEVKGISENGARQIAVQVAEKRELRQAMLFLQQYGISPVSYTHLDVYKRQVECGGGMIAVFRGYINHPLLPLPQIHRRQ